WVVLHWTRSNAAAVRQVLVLQSLIAMLGVTALAHIIYLGDDVTLPPPSLSFLAHYLAFGFSFEPDFFSIPPRVGSGYVLVVLSFLALALAGLPLRNGERGGPDAGVESFRDRRPGGVPSTRGSWTGLGLVASGAALVVIGMATLALRRQFV